MKIVVTGGAGFLGSHLCTRLIEEGHEVWCVDNLLTGYRKNISRLEEKNNFHFIEKDVCEDLPDLPKIDQVYHLASPASPNIHSPKSYHVLAFETMQVNTIGTRKMAELALANKATLLFASTSEIYGDPLEHPQKETYNGNVSTTGPRSVYDEAKRFGETIVAAFVRSRGLDGRIVRIFNTYGPGMAADDGRVITEFVSAARKNEPLKIFGDGSQTRSFCFVSDLIKGLVMVMNQPGITGEIFNLGNPGEFTIRQLADLVVRMCGSKSPIVTKDPLPTDDPQRRRPDISKIKSALGWEPVVDLEEGLKKTIAAFELAG
jgi:UDP-glucuronate decarboxylase